MWMEMPFSVCYVQQQAMLLFVFVVMHMCIFLCGDVLMLADVDIDECRVP